MGEVESEISPSKKRKSEIKPANSEHSPEKKAKTFCCKTFRQELRGSEPLKSLKRFIQAVKTSNELITEYMECGGSLQEILSLIDLTASGDLTTALPVFDLVHLILLRFQSLDPKHHEKCMEAARTILRSYLPIIKAILSMNVAKQKKVALKLLTAIATLDSTFANEIINVVALSPELISDLIRPFSNKDSVRKSFILFLLSFLIEGNTAVLRNLLEKKGFLGSIIPGLKFDESETVNLTLSLMEDKILKNVGISKTLKVKLFNTWVVRALFDLFDWKGLQGVKQLEVPKKKKNKMKVFAVDKKEKEIVTESVYSFLMLLCCSKKHGIAFSDKSLGTSNEISNELILNALKGLSNPLSNSKLADVVLKILCACPDLITPVLEKFESSFQPRHSKNWFDAVEFAENLIKGVDATSLVKNESEPPSIKRIVKIGQTLCAPVVFLRVIKSGSANSQPAEIQLRSLKFLSTLWREIGKLFASQNFGDELKKHQHHHFSKFLPDIPDLMQLWQTLCGSQPLSFTFLTDTKSSNVSSVLDVLHMVVDCQEDTINVPNLTLELLSQIEQIKDTMSVQEFNDIQVKILRFMERDLEMLLFSPELFEKTLLILLQSADDSSFSFLSKLLASLDIFQRNKQEIDIWIACYMSLSKEYCTSAAELFVKSIRRCFEARNDVNELLVTCSVGNTNLPDMENGSSDISKQPLTNFVFACLEVLKSSKNQQTAAFEHFLNDVIIHLQHFYSIDMHLHDHFKEFTKVISKPVLKYLKKWKENMVTTVNSDILTCPLELNVASWLLNNEDERQFHKIVDTNSLNLLKRQSLFRLTLAYLNMKIKNQNWSENDVDKFSEALSCLLKNDVAESDQDDGLIAYDLNNVALYRLKCLNCLLSNNNLLDGFDVCRKKQNTLGRIVFKVFIENEIFKNLTVKRRLTGRWKQKFVTQLVTKLKKSGSLHGIDDLEKVFNFFEFDLPDIAEVVGIFKIVSDLDLFVDGDSPSSWMKILIKFCMLHCEKQELSEEILKKLCLIMEHFCDKNVTNLDEFDKCFVCLLRSRPRHLLYINKEFLRMILQRSNTTLTTRTLGKLLLNDPDKVKYFLEIVTNELEIVKDHHLMFSLLSILIVNDAFLDTFNIKELYMVWKSSEISLKNTPDIYKALESVYRKFEKTFVKSLTKENVDLISQNLNFSREMVKLFFDEKQISKIKTGIEAGKFHPELMFEAVRKLNIENLTESYIEGLVTMLCHFIKNPKDGDNDWSKYCTIVSDLIGRNISWENVVASPNWKEFPKLSIGHCFSSGGSPSLLKVLRLLIDAFYPPEESDDCALFFQMAISHSQFLKIMLSNSPLKNELVELFYALIERCPSEMSAKHVPILLASYNASLSSCDITLLKVLHLYEKNGIKIREYEPFVWGEAAVSHYSVGTGRGLSLWQRFNMNNVLNLFDEQRMEMSLKEFPLHRSLKMNIANEANDSVVYDPSFVLPLFVNLLSPGSVAFCLSFIHKGGLAFTVRALSSKSMNIRAIAALVLARLYNHLELCQNLKQKLVWMHFINCFRYGIKDISAMPLPNIATLFFARLTLELSGQPTEMYHPLQQFLLAKPQFAFDTVPEFLPLFYSSEVAFRKHRAWLLDILRDGTKTPADINVIFRSMAVKNLFSFFHSHLCDNLTKKLTLQVIERMLRIKKSILLISEYGLLSWITSIDPESCQIILQDLLALLSTTANVVFKNIKERNCTHSETFHVVQILNMAVKLLPSLKTLKSVEIFQTYLKLVLDCMLFFVERKTQWFTINKNRLFDLIEAGTHVLGERNDCEKFCKVPFYFREFYDSSVDVNEDFKNLIFVFNTLANTMDKRIINK